MSKLEKVKKYVESKKEGKLLKLVHDKDQQVRLAAIWPVWARWERTTALTL